MVMLDMGMGWVDRARHVGISFSVIDAVRPFVLLVVILV
jgi:hypothetical protein